MNNISKIVDDIFSQMQLHVTMKRKAVIAVYVAKQNFKPVVDRLLDVATNRHGISFETLDEYTKYVHKYLGHTLNVLVKPEPHHASANHLLLTVGGLTAIIFDYEESI